MSRGAQFLNDQMVQACMALTGFEMTERVSESIFISRCREFNRNSYHLVGQKLNTHIHMVLEIYVVPRSVGLDKTRIFFFVRGEFLNQMRSHEIYQAAFLFFATRWCLLN